jgi:hypothetical protein
VLQSLCTRVKSTDSEVSFSSMVGAANPLLGAPEIVLRPKVTEEALQTMGREICSLKHAC